MHCTDYQYITECRQPLFLYTRCMHLSARCMHLSAPPSLRTSAPNYSAVIPPAQFGIGGNGFLIRATEKSTSRYCSNRPTQALRHNAVAEENRGRISVQTSASKCRRVQTVVQIKNKVVYTT